jgi:hypothetical protein
VGLATQYGSGVLPGLELGDTLRHSYVYREHFLDISASLGNFSLWSNLEFSSPPQIGPDHRGLRKVRLAWDSNYLSIQLGDLYGQVGRGLALNMWENQGIDWDSSLRGVRVDTRPFPWLVFNIIHGQASGGRHLSSGPGIDPRIRDFTDRASVTAVVAQLKDLAPGITLGGYSVATRAVNPWFSIMRNFRNGDYNIVDTRSVDTHSWMPGLFTEVIGANFDLYLELTGRRHEIPGVDSLYSTPLSRWLHYERQSQGWGGYASLSLYPGRWGFTLEYKNYLFDDSDPQVRRHLPYRLGRRTPLQNPPSVFREHSSILLGRQPHVMDFEDEVGLQFEANLEITPSLFLILNYAHSSRHTAFSQQIQPDFTSRWQRSMIASPFWMATDRKYYPFREFYGEVNAYHESLSLDIRGGISLSSEMLEYYEALLIESEYVGRSKLTVSWEQRKLLSLPLLITMGLFSDWGLTLSWEHQWERLESGSRITLRRDEYSREDSLATDAVAVSPYYYRYLALSVGKPSRFSFGIVVDYASDIKTGQPQNTDPDEDSWLETLLRRSGIGLTNKWFGIQLTRYLTPSTILTAFYGSLQGGLKCDSGVCVYVPGIEDAVTLSITSNF